MELYDSIRNGRPWLDTNGNRIQAHGGSIHYQNGVFYWYGENKEKTLPGLKVWHWGVRAYSSADLYNWKDEGLLLPPDTNDPQSPLYPEQGMDRPHILRNARTGLYVLWVKIMNRMGTPGLGEQFMTVAVSPRFSGPYTIVRSFRPLGMDSGDFDLVQDAGGKAYLYFERVHSELICADLTDDYTDVTGRYSTHFPRPYPPFVREAPAFFSRGGRLYLFTSGTTGYFPNPSEAATALSHHGPWKVLGHPHPGDESHTSFRTQISSVFRHPKKKDLYIALADRWLVDLPERLPDIGSIFEGMFGPRKGPPEEAALLASLTAENTSLAEYVWLPVRFTPEGMPLIGWLDEWRIEDFD